MAKLNANETYLTKPGGAAFDSAEDALEFMRKNELAAGEYTPLPDPKGGPKFVVANLLKLRDELMVSAERPAAKPKAKSVNILDIGPYHRVIFAGKGPEDNDEQVPIGCQGVQMWYDREIEVILSHPQYLVITTSEKNRFESKNNETRKVGRPSKCFPISQQELLSETEGPAAFAVFYKDYQERLKTKEAVRTR